MLKAPPVDKASHVTGGQMAAQPTEPSGLFRSEQDEIRAAGREAAAIGGTAGDEHLDPARRPLIEAGEGEAEGFELAEQELIEAAEYGDPAMDPMRGAFTPEVGRPGQRGTYGEADHEESAEVRETDR
jgi:hypothetical protein